MTDIKRIFMVNGKPFYSVGAQSRNSSGYNDSESETAFKAIKLLHGNTLEIPVYWEQVEPEEGKFDFTSVDALIASARRYGIKLVLLWFATWKNGNMDYAPEWVKTNPQRFKRVISSTDNDLWVLSSHCPANCEADKAAFTALCNHLKAKDSTESIVIALQIENEPGILGSDRDYGTEAQAEFDSLVPAELVTAMRAAGKGQVYHLWQQAGGKESGTWPELFGWAAGELMSAWSIATYIDGLAEAGQASYDIPMYINVWLGSTTDARPLPGEDYPSGGAVNRVLDIYKWFTPHVGLIAPDIYIQDSRSYEAVCASYARDDNPLFVPESAAGSGNTWNMFRAIANYNAIGYHFFAVEHIVAEDGSVRPEFQTLVDSVRCVAAAIPLLLKYQGTGKIHAIIQEEFMQTQLLDLDGYLGRVLFAGEPPLYTGKDWRHATQRTWPAGQELGNNRGRGLVIQASRNEFYLVGANYQLLLRPKLPPDKMRASSFVSDQMINMLSHTVSVDEGHFDQNGEFVVDRRRNGDEICFGGLWVEADIGVLRAIMCD